MLELFSSIKLDKKLKEPLYLQLYMELKEFIVSGSLLSDYRLPSVRQMSKTLNINQITVVSAFRQLESEGYVYTKTGSGTYVASMLPIKIGSNADESVINDELYNQDDVSLISSGQVNISENTINFASATPTPDLFPVDNFKIALNETLDRDKGNAFSYQESQGFLPLRECICGLLSLNNIESSPGSIQIISGAQQGIDIISKAFLRQGDYVITESPTYTGAIAVFKSRGAEIIDIEIDKDGMDLNLLEYNLKKYKPKLIYTIPSFQNPTGYSYSHKKRLELLKLAERYDTYVIEDDYVSDLDFEEKKYPPIKALDKNNRVIFIKSFSKIFMPGLRLGFMISPPSMQNTILQAKHTTDISTSGLIQRAFDLYIRKGYWDKHFKFMYDIYKKRYFETLEALEENLPDNISFFRPGGGLNIWLDMPFGFPINNLLKRTASSDIVFAPGKIFYSNSSCQKLNNIRISFAAVPEKQIKSGIRSLCKIISALNQKQDSNLNIPIL
ncbi:MAG: PLP-dependent aminotransferase family protein [Clostridia bacterium]|nr:PLP-dependent aminotransferase family protein [Clostridia bacterium]